MRRPLLSSRGHACDGVSEPMLAASHVDAVGRSAHDFGSFSSSERSKSTHVPGRLLRQSDDIGRQHEECSMGLGRRRVGPNNSLLLNDFSVEV